MRAELRRTVPALSSPEAGRSSAPSAVRSLCTCHPRHGATGIAAVNDGGVWCWGDNGFGQPASAAIRSRRRSAPGEQRGNSAKLSACSRQPGYLVGQLGDARHLVAGEAGAMSMAGADAPCSPSSTAHRSCGQLASSAWAWRRRSASKARSTASSSRDAGRVSDATRRSPRHRRQGEVVLAVLGDRPLSTSSGQALVCGAGPQVERSRSGPGHRRAGGKGSRKGTAPGGVDARSSSATGASPITLP